MNVLKSTPNTKIHNESPSVLDGTSFPPVQIENSIVQISKDLSMEPTANFQQPMDALNDYIHKEKPTEIPPTLLGDTSIKPVS